MGTKLIDAFSTSASKASELMSKCRLFAVVIVYGDGTERLHSPQLYQAARAIKIAACISSGHVHDLLFAEAREIDVKSLNFTGRVAQRDDVEAEVSLAADFKAAAQGREALRQQLATERKKKTAPATPSTDGVA